MKGTCPYCNAAISLLGDILQCPNCGEYVQTATAGRIVPVNPGQIERQPCFDVRIAPLLKLGRMPTVWRWPRPLQCCVCGLPASREFYVYFDCLQDYSESYEALKTYQIPIPHCNKHKNGITYESALGQLSFCSFDYWREFRALNQDGLDSLKVEIKEQQAETKCFIATAACGSPHDPAVQALRNFRETVLLSHRSGQLLVQIYVHVSPYFARLVERRPLLRWIVRTFFVMPAARIVRD